MKTLTAVLLLLAPAVHAQVVYVMTPERIREAIKAGEAAKDILHIPGAGFLKGHGTAVTYSTPYGRVAQAAFLERQKYQALTFEQVTNALVRPGWLRIHADPANLSGSPWSVKAIVIMPEGADDAARVIQPLISEPERKQYGNRLGATYEADALTAWFPLTVFVEGNELRVVWTGYERKARFRLNGVR